MSQRITDLDVLRMFACPHWPYWERFGDPLMRRPPSPFEEQDLAERLWREQALVHELFPHAIEIHAETEEEVIQETKKRMEEGVEVIYRGVIAHENWLGRPTLLRREEGASVFGAYRYAPIDFRRAHELHKNEVFHLCFFGTLLERVQGAFPGALTMINADKEVFVCDIEQSLAEFASFMERLERTCEGELPPPVYRKACQDTSPWGALCFRLAQERDDIALLFNATQKQLQALRGVGIETVHQAAEMDPTQLELQVPGLTLRALTSLQRQARSLVDRSVTIRAPFVAVPVSCELFFDIESHPATDRDYLYGFIQREGDRETGFAFTAETPEEEEGLWRQFLAWLPTLPADYRVFHYGDYEAHRLRVLALRYQTEENPWLERFLSRCVDVKDLMRDHAVFPLYFYSLKAIAGFLGFVWREQETIHHGRDSVQVFEQWIKTGNRALWEGLRRYNEDDVRATLFLLDWLKKYAIREAVFLEPYPWYAER